MNSHDLRLFMKTSTPHTAQKRLPSKQFQVLLTPSSGCFSSFPHGTCSLSVSCPYLALDGTYHPLRAAIPNNSTLSFDSVHFEYFKEDEAITLHGGSFQEHFSSNQSYYSTIRLQFSKRDFNFELFPLHSPLLKES